MDKDVVCVHTHNTILLSHKKEWNNAICSNIEVIVLNEVRQKTNITWYHVFMESEENDTNEFIYKTEIESHM